MMMLRSPLVIAWTVSNCCCDAEALKGLTSSTYYDPERVLCREAIAARFPVEQEEETERWTINRKKAQIGEISQLHATELDQSFRANRDRIHQHEERESVQQYEMINRRIISNLRENMKPIRQLVDDCQRVSAQLLMAQKQIEDRIQIPNVLHRIIHEYSDHNEIRILFRIFMAREDRAAILGFMSYEEMHQEFPTTTGKMMHLQVLRQGGDLFRGQPYLLSSKITFDQQRHFITGISIRQTNGAKRFEDKFNWGAVADLRHLEVLRLKELGMYVSMRDIRRMPTSLKVLEICGNIWTGEHGVVDLSLLPPALREFNAIGCSGMYDVLKLDAPNSCLELVAVKLTDLVVQLLSEMNVPPKLRWLIIDGDRVRNAADHSIIRVLEKYLVQVV